MAKQLHHFNVSALSGKASIAAIGVIIPFHLAIFWSGCRAGQSLHQPTRVCRIGDPELPDASAPPIDFCETALDTSKAPIEPELEARAREFIDVPCNRVGSGFPLGYFIYISTGVGKLSVQCEKCQVVVDARRPVRLGIKGPTKINLGKKYIWTAYALDSSGQELHIGEQSHVDWRVGRGLKKVTRKYHINPIQFRPTALGRTKISASFFGMTADLSITVVPRSSNLHASHPGGPVGSSLGRLRCVSREPAP